MLSIAASTVRFSIVATSSQSPVLILAGIPQSHYVESGVNEYFKFYPHADEDLHITLTARSGDPDMFVSTEYMKPHCTKSTDPYSSLVMVSHYYFKRMRNICHRLCYIGSCSAATTHGARATT